MCIDGSKALRKLFRTSLQESSHLLKFIWRIGQYRFEREDLKGSIEGREIQK